MASVGVVIPCYNAARHLDETLRSVVAQTRPADEIIVVDDGSTDASVAIARRFGVTCISTGANIGLPAARNVGIRYSRAELIALMDADDLWLPHHLASVSSLLERFPEAGLAFSRVRLFGDMDYEQDQVLPAHRPVDAFWECVRDNFAIPSSCLVRRSAWEAIGGFDPELRAGAEDFDFSLRLSRRYPFISTGEVTVRYRKYAEQMSSNKAACRTNEYRSRERFLHQSRQHESIAFMAQMEEAMRAAWDERIYEAWSTRNRTLLDFYLSLGRYIPNPEGIRRRWRRRSHLMWALAIWDRLPRPVRESLKELGGQFPQRMPIQFR